MGMEGEALLSRRLRRWEPHACGDGRQPGISTHYAEEGAPRVWGWKAVGDQPEHDELGRPTRVGTVSAKPRPHQR